jgi:hypothetical protein
MQRLLLHEITVLMIQTIPASFSHSCKRSLGFGSRLRLSARNSARMCFCAIISTALGGRIVFVGSQYLKARSISIAFSGRIVLVGAQALKTRLIGIAFSGRIVLVGEQVLIARFISIPFGGCILLVGA